MNNTELVKFENTEIEIYDHEGNRWAVMSHIAAALGYSNTHNFYRLIDRNTDEFKSKQGVVKMTTPGGNQELRVISYHGVIRAAMLAKTDRAKAFRDWAEDVLFAVMTRGKYELKSKWDKEQELCHEDITLLRGLIADDPRAAEWVYPRIQYRWDNYASNYVEPKIAVTPLTKEWFKSLYIGKGWSKDVLTLYFPFQLRNSTDFENYRKQWGIPAKKSLPVPLAIAMQMFVDYHQFHMRIDAIVLKYFFYSRDVIRRQLKFIETNITEILANNQVMGVKRFEKKSYEEYRKMPEWCNKKAAMITPTGPFDRCWDCLRPISLSTVHLHHMLYDRVGFELWTDFRPLCATCHAFRHADKLPTVTGVATIDNVRVLQDTGVNKALLCEVDGEKVFIPKFAIKEQSRVKKMGDTGILVIDRKIALEKGLVSMLD